MSGPWSIVTTGTAVLAAVSAGTLLTFSTVTTSALARLPDAEGMAAMQAVNEAAPRSAPFMLVLFAPGLLGAVLAARAVRTWSEHPASSALVVGAAGLYLVGVVGTTIGFHVPRNDALAALDAVVQHDGWRGWLRSWVAGNHVRTVCALVTAVLVLTSQHLSADR